MKQAPAALLGVALLSIPALAAALWLGPRVPAAWQLAFRLAGYVYFLAGVLWISRRRWSLANLGWISSGIGFTLLVGAPLLAGRVLMLYGLGSNLWNGSLPGTQLAADALLAFGVVALVQETMFRGLIYRALEDWRGTRAAILGSSAAFALWYAPSGVSGILGGFLFGLLYAAMRWRARGIVGIILIHGAAEFISRTTPGSVSAQAMRPGLIALGYCLTMATPLLIWKLKPTAEAQRSRRDRAGEPN